MIRRYEENIDIMVTYTCAFIEFVRFLTIFKTSMFVEMKLRMLRTLVLMLSVCDLDQLP